MKCTGRLEHVLDELENYSQELAGVNEMTRKRT